jgi:HEAT repeat protein
MGLFDRFKGKKSADPRLSELIAQLRDADPARRLAAAGALGDLGAAAQAAVPDLEEAIADSDGDVCLAASDALARIRKEAHS